MTKTRYTWKRTREGFFGLNLLSHRSGTPIGCLHLHRSLEAVNNCSEAGDLIYMGYYNIVATEDNGQSFRRLSQSEQDRIADIDIDVWIEGELRTI